MNTTDKIMALANTYAASYGKALLEKLYGTSQSYTEQCEAEAFKNREAMLAEIEALVRDAERLDHLQKTGSTVDLVPGDASFYPMRFRVGGWHSSVNENIRAAIDAAMQEKQP